MKKITLFFVCAIVFSIQAWTQTNGTTGNLNWNLDSNGVLTISGTDTMLNYSIGAAPWYPNRDSVKTLIIENGVKSIGDFAFVNCKSIKSVDIVNTVKKIGEGAFGGCENLISVAIGDSVESIGMSAFQECLNLTSIIIPNNVKNIGSDSFYSCRSLASVVIGDGVTSIGTRTFFNCVNLLSLSIGKNVKDIGVSAFENCFDLTSVTIPESVVNIQEDAFYACEKLVEVYNLSDLAIQIGSKDHGRVAYSALVVHTSANAQSIITHEGDYIFAYHENAGFLLAYKGNQTDLTFPEMFEYNGQEIESYSLYKIAFYEKINLTSITLPESVTSIGDRSFVSCLGLTSVAISNSVDSIKWLAFYNCKNLTSLTIGNGVKAIGASAFGNCENLENIYSFSINPPVCENMIFDEVVPGKCLLHVPAGRKRVYGTAYVWRDFNISAPEKFVKVSVSANNADYGTVTDIDSVDIYTEITLRAASNYGYIFSNWSSNGEIIAIQNPYDLTVIQDTTIVANFVFDTFDVSLNVDNDSYGSIRGNGNYAYNSEVTIEALPNHGYKFLNWMSNDDEVSLENPLTFTISKDTTLVANFALDTFYVTLNTNNMHYGSVLGSGEYAYNSEVTIEAFANENYIFIGWYSNDEIVSVESQFTFNITGDTSLVATFMEIGGVGIEDIDIADFNIYPNPVKDIIYIEAPHTIQKAVLYNVKGQIVMQQEDIRNNINVSALPKGAYILKLTTCQGEVMTKVVK